MSVRREAVPVVAVLLLYRAGSVSDPEGLTGLSHLTEHMMFRGSSGFPDGSIDELTNSLGGVNNAMTTSDYVAYYFVLPRENWRVALEIEADRMASCLLENAAFETERRIAIEERRMLDDEPESVLDEALESLAFEEHPYRFPVVGVLEDLERISLGDLRTFYEKHYRPDNAVLVVVGDVGVDDVERAARESFRSPHSGAATAGGGARAPSLSREIDVPVERPQLAPRNAMVRRESGIPRVTVGFHCPEATHADSLALEVASVLLGSGRSSRLYRRLVAPAGDVNEVSVGRMLQRYPGLFTVTAELSEGGDVGRCERAILDELDVLSRVGPSPEELEKAKRLWRLDHSLGRESSLGLAGFLGFWELLGRWELGEEFDAGTSDVTCEDVARAAGRYLDPQLRNSAWMIVEND